MYEDIEILRRLLDSKLVSEYPPAKVLAEAQNSIAPYRLRLLQNDGIAPSWFQAQTDPAARYDNFLHLYNAVNQPHYSLQSYFPLANEATYEGVWYTTAPARVLDTEGSYLKGQGVIYTLTLPPPACNPREQTSRSAPPSVSDWERIRGELHNEKPKPEAEEHKGQPRKEPSLAEIILKVLAENGHHFAQLGDEESLTVIVTFRGNDPPPTQKTQPDKPTTHQKSSSESAAEGLAKLAASQALASNAHDYELLAELHMKQGKYAEAEQALRQGIEQKPDPKQLAGLYRKLAELYLKVGKDAEARQALDKAMELAKGGQAEAPQPAKEAKPVRSALPGKLIISAPKKLLDQIGNSKITPEEFQKAATVEYLTFHETKE
jgi:tetratricopeptide (TPR) repeat protein